MREGHTCQSFTVPSGPLSAGSSLSNVCLTRPCCENSNKSDQTVSAVGMVADTVSFGYSTIWKDLKSFVSGAAWPLSRPVQLKAPEERELAYVLWIREAYLNRIIPPFPTCTTRDA